MAQANSQDGGEVAGKGKPFFDRADEVVETGNWDFAIEMYLEGIKREPDNVQRGHQRLWEAGLKRKYKGGKPASMIEQLKHRPGKDPVTNLVNAQFLMAKDPGALAHMELVLKCARALSLPATTKWIADIMLEWQSKAVKPPKRVLLLLIDAYAAIEEYRLAIEACQIALKFSPEDNALVDMLSDFSAKHTIKKGKYDQEGDFVKGVKDLKTQEDLIQKDSLSQSKSFLEEHVDKARADYLASPTVIGKINILVDTLLKLEREEAETEAVNVLTKAHQETGSYQFKSRIGDIRIAQMTRKYRKLAAAGDKEAAIEQAKRQLAFEIEEYSERAVNYPTDLGLKFELGRRLFMAGRYDDSIGLLQQAQREPRRQLQAMNYLGQAFAKKGWLPEAAQTLERALQVEGMTETATLNIRYSLGDVLEQMGELQRAQEQFSKVAQADFNFKDVRARVDVVRKKLAGGG
ncbi:MAG: tetratricopeptide repeat protein [Phycisphaerae bacterium]|jgi:tetratricopeptide (TPR) repeat protein